MAVVFDLGNGTTCAVQNNSQTIMTNDGSKQADAVVTVVRRSAPSTSIWD